MFSGEVLFNMSCSSAAMSESRQYIQCFLDSLRLDAKDSFISDATFDRIP